MQHQISIQDLLSGRMFPEHSVATKERTSEPSCKRSATSARKADGFQYLNLKEDGGNLLGLSWETVGALPGESMTLNFGESPSEGRESTLSQILDLTVPDKYSLSPRACAGILKRAERRGKTLPNMLRDALTEAVGLDGWDEIVERKQELPR